MDASLILASASPARRALLDRAGIAVQAAPAGIDEDMVTESMRAEDASVEAIVRALAEAKARKLSSRRPEALVIGADQLADLDGALLGKPADRPAAERQLHALSGRTHRLHTAVTVAKAGESIWSHHETAALTMRSLSQRAVHGYLDRNFQKVRGACGGYMIEEEGVRLFSDIQGDLFTIQGLPLVALINFLIARGSVAP